jgi:hypothetical protein
MKSLWAIRCTALSTCGSKSMAGGAIFLSGSPKKTSGEGSQNRADPASGTNQGEVAMGFYNMSAGDAPYFRELADTYALSDNYHQPMMGGTGANFQAAATGHAIAYWEEGAWRSRRKTRSRTRTRATHSVRHAHSIDRRLALREERRGRPHLYRPRCDPQIHRGELASRPAIGEEPRPSAQPDRRPVRPRCLGQPASDRRSDEPLCFLSSGAEGVQQHTSAAGRVAKHRGDRSVGDCISYARSRYRDVAIERDLGTDTNLDGGFL